MGGGGALAIVLSHGEASGMTRARPERRLPLMMHAARGTCDVLR